MHWLEPVSLEELPYYLMCFDVCIIPNTVNSYTQYVYPRKLNEYLASGKPVVSTNLPALAGLEKVVDIAHNYGEFIRHLERRVNNPCDSSEATMRRQIAQENSWDKLAQNMLDITFTHMG